MISYFMTIGSIIGLSITVLLGLFVTKSISSTAKHDEKILRVFFVSLAITLPILIMIVHFSPYESYASRIDYSVVLATNTFKQWIGYTSSPGIGALIAWFVTTRYQRKANHV